MKVRTPEYSYDRPLIIAPSFSRVLTAIVVLSHALAILFVFTLLELNIIISISLGLCILISFVYYYRWHINKSLNKSVLEVKHILSQHKQGCWNITLANHHDLSVDLLPSSFVSVSLIVLNFKDHQNHQYSLIVPSDAVPKEVHRQLRVIVNTLS